MAETAVARKEPERRLRPGAMSSERWEVRSTGTSLNTTQTRLSDARRSPSTGHRPGMLAWCSPASLQRDLERGLALLADLEDAHTPHIQEVASPDVCHADEHRVADGAAEDRPHAMHVGGGRPHRHGGAAAGTGDLGHRHVKGEDRLQDACGSVAIELVLHHLSPVGPNRSVLMCAGSYPRVTRLAAAVSTNGVGPQMNTRGC